MLTTIAGDSVQHRCNIAVRGSSKFVQTEVRNFESLFQRFCPPGLFQRPQPEGDMVSPYRIGLSCRCIARIVLARAGSKIQSRNSGGSFQRFCSSLCRGAFNTACRVYAASEVDAGRLQVSDLKMALGQRVRCIQRIRSIRGPSPPFNA